MFSNFFCCAPRRSISVIEEQERPIPRTLDIHMNDSHYNEIEGEKREEARLGEQNNTPSIEDKILTPQKAEELETETETKIKSFVDIDNEEYNKLLIDEKYIREDEKAYITFVSLFV